MFDRQGNVCVRARLCLSQFHQPDATKSVSTPLDGMLVHSRVTPSSVERGKVFCPRARPRTPRSGVHNTNQIQYSIQ